MLSHEGSEFSGSPFGLMPSGPLGPLGLFLLFPKVTTAALVVSNFLPDHGASFPWSFPSISRHLPKSMHDALGISFPCSENK